MKVQVFFKIKTIFKKYLNEIGQKSATLLLFRIQAWKFVQKLLHMQGIVMDDSAKRGG